MSRSRFSRRRREGRRDEESAATHAITCRAKRVAMRRVGRKVVMEVEEADPELMVIPGVG